MADKITFPKLSVNSWWNIRKKFKQTLPGTVTASYLSSVLNMQEKSANANIMPYLKQLGIIDQDGKTGERAKLWRDDTEYPDVCDAIRNEIYPRELLDIPVMSEDDRSSVKRWFSRATGSGEKAVDMYAAFYFLLCDKDPNKETNGTKPQTKTIKVPSKPKSTSINNPAVAEKESENSVLTAQKNAPVALTNHQSVPSVPAININLQIHISSDATPEQIDKIFESMSKHIYNRKDDLNG